MSRKTADEWFSEYAVCHKNVTNKLIHWFCIPAITLSILAFFWIIPVPMMISDSVPSWNWAWLFVALVTVFYVRLSWSLSLGMLLFALSCLGSIWAYESLGGSQLGFVALGIFIIAWIAQFIGHKIEGKKPAFLDDLKFLLIGPLWLLGFIYRKLGIPY